MLSRRNFINSTLAASAAVATQGTQNAMAQGNRHIVDAQVHLWKAESPDWPWVPGRKPQLPEPFTIEKLVPLMDEAGVDRAVIVPPSWPGDRNDYGLEAAQKYPKRFAVMGRIPLEKREQSAALLSKWREQPGMVGVRLTFQGNMLPLLTEGHADWYWPMAEKLQMPTMFFAPGNIPKFAPIAERHPGLPMIIDHMSLNQEIAHEGRIAQAIDAVVPLAKFPNVSVKVSSAPTFSKQGYPWRDVTDAIKRCYDAFGPQRCYWGTDITNAYDKSTYKQRITHFTEELPFLSESDKDWMLGKAILQTLKWN